MHYVLNFLIALSLGLVTAWLVAGQCTTIYLHRCLSHGSLKLHPAMEWLMRLGLWITTGTKPRQWVAVHRKHHRNTDAGGDPHSPRLYDGGVWYLFWRNHRIYNAAVEDAAMVAEFAPDITQDKWDRWLFDRSYAPLVLLPLLQALVLTAIIGWSWQVLILMEVSAWSGIVFYIAMLNTINSFGHGANARASKSLGYSHNLPLLVCWLTVGEGNHYDHHANQMSPRIGKRSRDPGWWFIKLFGWFGLIKLRPVLSH